MEKETVVKNSDAVTELRLFQEYQLEEALFFISIHQGKNMLYLKSKLTKVNHFCLKCVNSWPCMHP